MTLLFLFATSLHAAELRMDPRVCQQLVKHTPDADVTYHPGVDVNGNKVAPADLNVSPLNKQLEHEFAIKLTNDTARIFGLGQAIPQFAEPPVGEEAPNTIPMAQMETQVGYITLKDGKPLFNGLPLTNDQQDQLAVLCIQKKNR